VGKNQKTDFNITNLEIEKDKESYAFSNLMSQGWLEHVNELQENKDESNEQLECFSFPDIKLIKPEEDSWITISIKTSEGVEFRTHHVFLNKEHTEEVRKNIFGVVEMIFDKFLILQH
jgi:hypothetical protein